MKLAKIYEFLYDFRAIIHNNNGVLDEKDSYGCF